MIHLLLATFFVTARLSPSAPVALPGDDSAQQAYLNQQVWRVQQQLALTTPQTVRVKAAMEAVVHGTATKTLTQALHEICTPAQFTIWTDAINAESERSVAHNAAAEVEQVEKTSCLDPAQQNQLKSAFYQIDFADRNFHYTAHLKTELEAHLDHVAAQREMALDKILTPSQLAQRTRISVAGLARPFPDFPALGLSMTFPADRSGWAFDGAAH